MDTIEAAYDRIIWELFFSISKRNAYDKLHPLLDENRFIERGFFEYASRALYNDYLYHEMKIFDKEYTASFFFLYKEDKELIDKFLLEYGLEFSEIEDLAKKIRLVRNKTHVHIDKKYVVNPQLIWEEAGIVYDENKAVIDKLFKVMHDAFYEKYDYNIEFSRWHIPYNGDGIDELINVLVEHGNDTRIY